MCRPIYQAASVLGAAVAAFLCRQGGSAAKVQAAIAALEGARWAPSQPLQQLLLCRLTHMPSDAATFLQNGQQRSAAQRTLGCVCSDFTVSAPGSATISDQMTITSQATHGAHGYSSNLVAMLWLQAGGAAAPAGCGARLLHPRAGDILPWRSLCGSPQQ